jgi:hypothetical protein
MVSTILTLEQVFQSEITELKGFAHRVSDVR